MKRRQGLGATEEEHVSRAGELLARAKRQYDAVGDASCRERPKALLQALASAHAAAVEVRSGNIRGDTHAVAKGLFFESFNLTRTIEADIARRMRARCR